MKSLIVYESMYGNTHTVAQQIADGLREFGEALVVDAADATAHRVAEADLVVVGGPTHMHGMTSAASRKAAVETASKPESQVHLDSEAAHLIGLRDWFDELADCAGKSAAAFDTRYDGPALLTGRASHGIANRLRHHHFHLLTEPESFIVGKDNHLVEGAKDSAKAGGESLVRLMTELKVSQDAF